VLLGVRPLSGMVRNIKRDMRDCELIHTVPTTSRTTFSMSQRAREHQHHHPSNLFQLGNIAGNRNAGF
jgi:hypothetical protein